MFVRGGFEFLCKFDALRRVIPEPFRQTKRSRTTHIPAPNLTVIPRQKERGKGKEVKRVWERGGEEGGIVERTQPPIPSCFSSRPLTWESVCCGV